MRTVLLTTLMMAIACTTEGPAGPAGPQGPTGPAGPQGPAGAAGTTLPQCQTGQVLVSTGSGWACGSAGGAAQLIHWPGVPTVSNDTALNAWHDIPSNGRSETVTITRPGYLRASASGTWGFIGANGDRYLRFALKTASGYATNIANHSSQEIAYSHMLGGQWYPFAMHAEWQIPASAVPITLSIAMESFIPTSNLWVNSRGAPLGGVPTAVFYPDP